MELTTKKIINVLPFDKDFKESLVASFDSLDPDQKLTTERIIWDLYDALYALRLEENIRLEMEASNDTDRPLSKEFYTKVKQKTDRDMTSQFVSETITVSLEAAKVKLEAVMSDQ